MSFDERTYCSSSETYLPAVASIDPVVLNERHRAGRVNRAARLSKRGSFLEPDKEKMATDLSPDAVASLSFLDAMPKTGSVWCSTVCGSCGASSRGRAGLSADTTTIGGMQRWRVALTAAVGSCDHGWRPHIHQLIKNDGNKRARSQLRAGGV